MDYNSKFEKPIVEGDKAFAREFENFVNGRMQSANLTGRELANAHRFLQQEMFKVFVAFMRRLANNYHNGWYDDRNEWAARVAAEAYDHLTATELIYDPEYSKAIVSQL